MSTWVNYDNQQVPRTHLLVSSTIIWTCNHVGSEKVLEQQSFSTIHSSTVCARTWFPLLTTYSGAANEWHMDLVQPSLWSFGLLMRWGRMELGFLPNGRKYVMEEGGKLPHFAKNDCYLLQYFVVGYYHWWMPWYSDFIIFECRMEFCCAQQYFLFFYWVATGAKLWVESQVWIKYFTERRRAGDFREGFQCLPWLWWLHSSSEAYEEVP
jgi:hypothetical protein